MNTRNIKRRDVLKIGLKSAALGAVAPMIANKSLATSNRLNLNTNSSAIVVGAGAFGGWTALHLLRKGIDVTLVDQFGPGNNQSSSGGETRLIRAFYDKQIYFDQTLRAVELWKENEPKMGQKVFHQTGLLLFNYKPTTPELEVAWPMYKKAGLILEKISAVDAAKRWPQISTGGLDHVMYDPQAGYLDARNATIAVKDLFVKEGGKFIQQKVKDFKATSGKATSIMLDNGQKVEADNFVFACGPWLTRLFPQLTKKFKVTRALELFFSTPEGESDLIENKLPTWMDRDFDGPFRSFGVPGSAYRGFKLGITPPNNNNVTDKFDTYDRTISAEELKMAQAVLAKRFPKMAGRPLIEYRVCQYTMTPDSDYVLDRHPEASNLWIMGGDSGHGFKVGPSFGELAANTVTGETKVMDVFALKRLLG
jgi:glycine/D-amino acid oxidase-like deaminating enzyme